MAKKTEYTATDLVEMLRVKYPVPKFAFVDQVPNGTSSNRSRVADAIAMGCWKSVNIELNGFEIKISRSDWRNELNDLSKSAVFQNHCHRWWIVAPSGIVKPEEMPAEWGLMCPTARGLVVKKAASMRTPEPVPFAFLAGIMRRCVQANGTHNVIEAAHREGYRTGYQSGVRQGEWAARQETAYQEDDLNRLNESLAAFQEKSGICINEYNGGQIGAAVHALKMLTRPESIDRERRVIQATAGRVVADLEILSKHLAGCLTSIKEQEAAADESAKSIA